MIISSIPSFVKSHARSPYTDADKDKTRQTGNVSARNDKPLVGFTL